MPGSARELTRGRTGAAGEFVETSLGRFMKGLALCGVSRWLAILVTLFLPVGVATASGDEGHFSLTLLAPRSRSGNRVWRPLAGIA